eukprot:TRINITY_DN4672_c0_g1_i1.p1 TRINITY_DN4672_c0_g1~~TRINITY_DN4672_c0_g1_i1.p1  ORF type:complete len:436 (+),score=81.65 TRINITY_DN4672_c0_g1_i1:23-1330(+)
MSPLLYALFCIFGISSWLTVNGIFAELPTFALQLPESWAIASHLGIAIQIANIPAFLFFFATTRWRIPYPLSVYSLMILVVAATIGLAVSWSETAVIGGKERSIYLLVFTFLGGVVDCTTTFVFFPFVSQYEAVYSSALSAGEALSGGVISIFGFAQDQRQNSRNFSVSAFFSLTLIMIAASTIAFTIIYFTRFGKRKLLQADAPPAGDSPKEVAPLVKGSVVSATNLELFRAIRFPLLVQFVANFIENGIIVSLVSYAFLNYEDGDHIMSVAINTAAVTAPLACFAAAFKQLYRLSILVVIALLPTSYMLASSCMSPTPPLVNHKHGGWLMMVTYVILKSTLAYTKTMVYYTMKRRPFLEETAGLPDVNADVIGEKENFCREEGIMKLQREGKNPFEKSFLWCAMATQLGSGIGTLLFFILVNFTKSFVYPSTY